MNYSEEFKQHSINLARNSEISIAQTARDLGIKENTLYNCFGNETKRARIMQNPKNTIVKIFVDNRNVYGIRRVQQVLQQEDILLSKRIISRLMKEEGLRCKTKKKFKATTDYSHSLIE